MIDRDKLKKAIMAELNRQHDLGEWDSPYVWDESDTDVGIDGHVKLDPLVDAVIKALEEI